jgi:hypothetical protein
MLLTRERIRRTAVWSFIVLAASQTLARADYPTGNRVTAEAVTPSAVAKARVLGFAIE